MNVNQLGTFLEHQGFSDEQIDEFFLEHFGTKGMKWGIRKSKSKTGVSRARGALIEKSNRMSRNIKKAKSGEKYKVQAAIGRAFVGKKRQERNWNKSLKKMQEQRSRLKSGQLLARDRLALIGTTNLFDTFVSRTPR